MADKPSGEVSEYRIGWALKGFTKEVGPLEDATIVAGATSCNPEWKPVDVKNNSKEKFLTVTLQEKRTLENGPTTRITQVFKEIAPQEQRSLGCSGCGKTTKGQLCIEYSVLAAVYVAP